MRTNLSATLNLIQNSKDIWDQIAPQLPQQEIQPGFGVAVTDIT